MGDANACHRNGGGTVKIEKPHRFVAAFYIVTLAFALIFCTFNMVYDTIGRATGSVETVQYDFTTLTANDGVVVNGANDATTQGEDPQLLIENLATRPVEVRFDITFSENPGEVTLYYKKAGEEYSNTKKIYGKAQSDGTYIFTLPSLAKIDAIRVDPTNISNVTMHLNSFTLNAKRSAASYFAFSYSDIFAFLVYPALASAIAAWFINAFGQTKPRHFC